VALRKEERRKKKIDIDEDGGKQQGNDRQGWVWRRRCLRRLNDR